MSEIAVKVQGLGKRYRIKGPEVRYDTLVERLSDALATPLRRARKLLQGQATGAAELDETIWALKDVSFEVETSEVVGIIGSNGAGKSTLLKILSRITEPTEGYAEIRGRVESLLEVGTAFHPELSGRENVYLNGAVLGMGKAEIEAKFDQIVEFAGVTKFIDTPVKHYSSGMYLRLAFAVAAHLEPEILLVDEVLAVGDAAFQKKCLGKMSSVASEGRTVLFVSHDMAAIERLCERVIWLEDGSIRTSGDPKSVISEYLSSNSTLAGEYRWEDGLAGEDAGQLAVKAIRVLDSSGSVSGTLDAREAFTIEIEYEVLERLPPCRIGVLLETGDGITVFDAYDSDDDRYAVERDPGHYVSRCTIPGDLLSPDRYLITLNAGIPRVQNLAQQEGVLAIDITRTGAIGEHMPGGRRGVIRPRLEWEIESASERWARASS